MQFPPFSCESDSCESTLRNPPMGEPREETGEATATDSGSLESSLSSVSAGGSAGVPAGGSAGGAAGVSKCQHCRFYSPQGRRGGVCQLLDVPVQGGWDGCSLAEPPFWDQAKSTAKRAQLEKSYSRSPELP